jgi:hypothetical protein
MVCGGFVLKVVDRVGEHREAVDAADLFLHALGAQHVAHGRARLDERKAMPRLSSSAFR